MIAGLLAG